MSAAHLRLLNDEICIAQWSCHQQVHTIGQKKRWAIQDSHCLTHHGVLHLRDVSRNWQCPQMRRPSLGLYSTVLLVHYDILDEIAKGDAKSKQQSEKHQEQMTILKKDNGIVRSFQLLKTHLSPRET